MTKENNWGPIALFFFSKLFVDLSQQLGVFLLMIIPKVGYYLLVFSLGSRDLLLSLLVVLVVVGWRL